MKPEQIRIWNHLVENAQGMNRAIHIAVIAQQLHIPQNGTNNDNIRRWIKEMVLNHQRPIGTCANGAFIILTNIEREEAARFVERRTVADAIRENGNYIPV
jgi:hypothetical protein